jgi:hypothetical protein
MRLHALKVSVAAFRLAARLERVLHRRPARTAFSFHHHLPRLRTGQCTGVLACMLACHVYVCPQPWHHSLHSTYAHGTARRGRHIRGADEASALPQKVSQLNPCVASSSTLKPTCVCRGLKASRVFVVLSVTPPPTNPGGFGWSPLLAPSLICPCAELGGSAIVTTRAHLSPIPVVHTAAGSMQALSIQA